MEPMYQALIDYGVAGLFLLYMIYTKFQDQKRADAQQCRYEEKLETLRKDSFSTQEQIRQRYTSVIDKYDLQIKSYSEERGELRQNLESSLDQIRQVVADNGMAIARLQTQVESWNLRITR